MRQKRRSHEERTAQDYREAAEDSLLLAKALAGQGSISDQDFLDRKCQNSWDEFTVQEKGEQTCAI